MKKIIFCLQLIFICLLSVSQSDTLFFQKGKKIACKIYEIGEYEIKYKRLEALDGPTYFVDKSTIKKYCLTSGFCETITYDELSLEQEHKEILGNRQVIKINPFSFAFSHIGIGYEKVIKVGMNLDFEAGYINSQINPQINIFGLNNNGNIFNSGFYFKPGVKFFLGQDFSVKGLKYAHPLKGRYIKLDLAVSNVNYNDVSRTYSSYYHGASKTVYSDVRTIAYGGFVNFGRQFILGNLFTIEYYYGIGFTAESISYTNSSFNTNPFAGGSNSNFFTYNEFNFTGNYHTFLRVPTFGLSFTGGFRIGYIIPEPKNKSKAVKN